MCCGSYELYLTQILRYLCQYFFLNYSLVHVTESVFFPFLNASSAQKWKGKNLKIKIQSWEGTLQNGFAEL